MTQAQARRCQIRPQKKHEDNADPARTPEAGSAETRRGGHGAVAQRRTGAFLESA